MEGEEEGETRQQQPLNSPAVAVHSEEGRRRRGGGFGAAAESPKCGQERRERDRERKVGRAGQNLFRLVAPARLARQACRAGVAGASG
jgi:hypothetical protein